MDYSKILGLSNGVYGSANYYGRLGEEQLCGNVNSSVLVCEIWDAYKSSKGPCQEDFSCVHMKLRGITSDVALYLRSVV